MTKRLSRNASELIGRALEQERIPAPAELAQVRRSILRAATALTVTTGAASPLAAQTLGAKALWFGVIGKSSFVSAVLLGMTVGGAAVGGGPWLAQKLERAQHAASQGAVASTSKSNCTGPTDCGRIWPSVLASPVTTTEPRVAETHDTSTTESPTQPRERAKRREAATPSAAAMSPTLDAVRTTIPQSATTAPPLPGSRTMDESAQVPPATNAVARFAPAGHPSLSEALAQLEGAQRALNRGNAVQALTLLDRLSTNGDAIGLVDDRLALEALAACKSGQLDRAWLAIHQLLRRSPNAPLVDRIRTACPPSVFSSRE